MSNHNLVQDFELFLKGPIVLFRWKNAPGWPVELATPNVQELFGYSVEDFTSETVLYGDLIHPEDYQQVKSEVQHVQDANLEFLTHKPYRVRRKDGAWIWLLDCTIRQKALNGETLGFVGYVMDITERVQTRIALQSNLDRLKQLNQLICDTNRAETLKTVYRKAVQGVMELLKAQRAAILIFGQDQKPHFVAWEGLSKDYRSKVDGHCPWNLFDIAASPIYIPNVALSELDTTLKETLKQEGIGALGFFPLVGPDKLLGKFMVYYDQPTNFSSEELHFAQILAEGLAAIFQRMVALERARENQGNLETKNLDLIKTLQELKETQETLVQRERLAAIGQLATGVAHDFNNLLSGVLGYSELILASSSLNEENQTNLHKIIKASKRGASLVQQLLDYSRKTAPKTQVLDLGPFLKNHLEFLRPLLPDSLLVQLHLPPNGGTPLRVSADPHQLQQLLTNLVLNAKDAMPMGGNLDVHLLQTREKGDHACVLCDQIIQGDFAMIRVQDSGRGIPPKLMDRIFEPFMTTKEAGMGSGLGLSQVAGILAQNQGHLTVDSVPSQGTNFQIFLPCVHKPSTSTVINRQDQSSGKGERILLVEDNEEVRAVTKKMLESLGYFVLATKDGKEALEQISLKTKENGQKLSLVLSDMAMPKMDGRSFFQEFHSRHPNTPFLIMSGYPPGGEDSDFLQEGIAGWLQKPISLRTLSHEIRKHIGQPEGFKDALKKRAHTANPQ